MTLSGTPAARARSRERWQTLRDRIASVSPEALGRGVLGVGVVALGFALAIASWPALAPFLAGAILAYAVLPIANRLDRFMPRVVAALLAELVAVAILVGVALVVVPPMINAVGRLAGALPTPDQVQARLANLQEQIGQLPEPMRTIVASVAEQVAADLQGVLAGAAANAGEFVTQQILGIFGTASFLLGLLVIPAWILTLVADERSIKRRGISLFAPTVRGDVAAAFRIVDRTLGTLLRVRVLLGLVSGFLIYVGLLLAQELGFGPFPYALAGAVLLGALQLIPELGFFLGFFPVLLVAAISGPVDAAVTGAVYFGAVRVASGLVETRLSRGVLDVHPGLLIPAIVVFSQFGTIWLFVAAPIVAILRDLVRYAAGRLGDPAAPANVLPGERVPRRTVLAAAVPVRSVYRDRVAASRPPAPAPAPAPATSQAPAAVAPARVAAIASSVPAPSAAAVIQRSLQP